MSAAERKAYAEKAKKALAEEKSKVDLSDRSGIQTRLKRKHEVIAVDEGGKNQETTNTDEVQKETLETKKSRKLVKTATPATTSKTEDDVKDVVPHDPKSSLWNEDFDQNRFLTEHFQFSKDDTVMEGATFTSLRRSIISNVVQSVLLAQGISSKHKASLTKAQDLGKINTQMKKRLEGELKSKEDHITTLTQQLNEAKQAKATYEDKQKEAEKKQKTA